MNSRTHPERDIAVVLKNLSAESHHQLTRGERVFIFPKP
jgi:hypothetical protein